MGAFEIEYKGYFYNVCEADSNIEMVELTWKRSKTHESTYYAKLHDGSFAFIREVSKTDGGKKAVWNTFFCENYDDFIFVEADESYKFLYAAKFHVALANSKEVNRIKGK